MESAADPADGIPDEAGSGWSWRWLIPLAGIITIAVLLWLIFLPPDTTDAATEALCVSAAQLSVTIGAAPAVTPDTPVEEMTTWLPEAGKNVVVVADLARSIGVNIDQLVASYDSLQTNIRAMAGHTVAQGADGIETGIEDLDAAVDSLAQGAGC
jgi:hypothetical protein